MGGRDFQWSDAHLQEIVTFDILYRINAEEKAETSVLLDRANTFLEGHFSALHSQGLLEISNRDTFVLSQKGRDALHQYGVMFKAFKSLSIFKCVKPDAPAPELEGEPDHRFGSYHEAAQPPHSEDYRLLIFENFCAREGRVAPLHMFVFFSLVENLRPLQSDEDWVWALESGELAERIQGIISSQPSADDISPEGMNGNDIVDAIYEAGMKEMKRCAEQDRDKYNPDEVERDGQDFMTETVVTETSYSDPEPVYVHHQPYYDDGRVSVGSAICVGAFAGLATCMLLS